MQRNGFQKIVDQVNHVPILLHSIQSVSEHCVIPFQQSLSKFTFGLLDYRKAQFLDDELQRMREFSTQYPNSTFHIMSAIFQLLYRGQTKIVDHEYDIHIDLNRAKELILDEKLQKRDALLLEAVLELSNGNVKQCCALHQQIAELFPKDLINAFLAYNSYIILYEMDPIEKLIEHKMLPHFTEHDHQRAYLDAMLCFIKEQKGMIDLAMQYGTSALTEGSKLEEKIKYQFLHPWTHHSLGHVYHQSAKLAEGIQFMNQVKSTWKECNFFMQHHNFWHLCLLYVESMQFEEAIAIYESHVWKMNGEEEMVDSWRNDNTVLAGALGILIRFELTVHLCHHLLPSKTLQRLQQWIQQSWEDVQPIVVSKWEKPQTVLSNLFLSIHIFYSLIRFDSTLTLDSLLSQIEDFVTNSKPQDYLVPIYTNALTTLIKTQYYYLHQQFDKGFQAIQSNATEFFEQQHHFGGSNEQREIIDLLYYNLLVKENQKKIISSIVKHRNVVTENRPFFTLDALREYHSKSIGKIE